MQWTRYDMYVSSSSYDINGEAVLCSGQDAVWSLELMSYEEEDTYRSAMEKLSFAVDTATTMAYLSAVKSSSSSSASSSSSDSSAHELPILGGGGGGGEGGNKSDPISRPYLAWAVQVYFVCVCMCV